jgi:hypothetical protein
MTVKCARKPVIILGMHRSGTSMVSELLDQLGLFVGSTLQDDHESTYFLDINDELLRRVSASWDQPMPFLDFLKYDDAVKMTADALAADLSSPAIRAYFGGSRWRGKASFETFEKPWGWKDPRTVFTLPVWLKLFPGAKLVYIIRNGVDVAKSLMVREKKLLKLRRERFDDRMNRRSTRTFLDRAGYKGSVRCLTLDGGFSLWEEYVRQADASLRGLTNPIHTLLYEDMLADPRKHLPELAAFCELEVNTSVVEKAVGKIDGSRSMAFAGDAEAWAFFHRIKSTEWMAKFGYDQHPAVADSDG